MAPALTIEFIVRSSFSSTAMTELKGRPVPFTPSRVCTWSGPTASHTRASTNGFDTLWIENSTSRSPTSTAVPRTPTTETAHPAGSARASAGM